MKPKKAKEDLAETEETKQKRKQLELLQKKWVSGLSTEPGAAPAIGEDFSILSGMAKPKDAGDTGRAAAQGERMAAAQAPPPQPQIDMDELKDFVRNTIRLEIDRAVRELKAEVDETSESSKKEILEELKMGLERIRNEVELAQPPRKSRGLFDRF